MSRTILIDGSSIDTMGRVPRSRGSVAYGRARGWYRLLFDAGPVDTEAFARLAGIGRRRARAWLAQQRAAGILRIVVGPDGGEELLLPGEFVPFLLPDGDVDPEFAAARRMQAAHDGVLPAALREHAHARIDADIARALRIL